MFPLMLSFCGMGCALLLNLNQEGLLAYVLLFPLTGAFLLCLFPGKNVFVHRWVALFFSLLTFLSSLLLWANFFANSPEPFQHIVGVGMELFVCVWNLV